MERVFEEDIFVVEGMQAGRLGVKFDGGRFSPKWMNQLIVFMTGLLRKYPNLENKI